MKYQNGNRIQGFAFTSLNIISEDIWILWYWNIRENTIFERFAPMIIFLLFLCVGNSSKRFVFCLFYTRHYWLSIALFIIHIFFQFMFSIHISLHSSFYFVLRTIYYFVFHFIFFRVSFFGNKLLMISICVSNEHTTEYKVIVSEKVWASSTAFHNSKCAQNLLCHLIRSELAYVIGWDGVSYIFHIFYHLFPPKCYTLVVCVSMRSTFICICMSFANFKMILFFSFVAFHSVILQIYFLIHLFSIYCSCLP